MLVGGVALLMVLRELNVDVMPMITGAGIAGVALGFGAQFLVRDLIAGFFLILEDQVRVGDSVVINGQGGGVEADQPADDDPARRRGRGARVPQRGDHDAVQPHARLRVLPD